MSPAEFSDNVITVVEQIPYFHRVVTTCKALFGSAWATSFHSIVNPKGSVSPNCLKSPGTPTRKFQKVQLQTISLSKIMTKDSQKVQVDQLSIVKFNTRTFYIIWRGFLFIIIRTKNLLFLVLFLCCTIGPISVCVIKNGVLFNLKYLFHKFLY